MLEQLHARECFGHEDGGVDELGDVGRLAARQRCHQAVQAEHADHIVERAAAHGQPRVAAVVDTSEQCIDGLVELEPLDLGARDHHRADLPLVEAEDVAHHLVLLALDDAGVDALFQAGRDLLLGDRARAVGPVGFFCCRRTTVLTPTGVSIAYLRNSLSISTQMRHCNV